MKRKAPKKMPWPKEVLEDVRRVRALPPEELDVDIEHFPHNGLLIRGLINTEGEEEYDDQE